MLRSIVMTASLRRLSRRELFLIFVFWTSLATLASVNRLLDPRGFGYRGISPVGQKARLRVVVDASAEGFDTVFVSAGRRGLQVELAPADLLAAAGASLAPIAAG